MGAGEGEQGRGSREGGAGKGEQVGILKNQGSGNIICVSLKMLGGSLCPLLSRSGRYSVGYDVQY